MKKVAIQGYAGSFHHIAAQQYEGSAVEILPCDTFRAVARAVERGEVDYGVMAIENSIAGSILPLLVPIVIPSRGVSPIVVSTDLPPSTAQILAPPPK